jgi:prevent-host-death family protein
MATSDSSIVGAYEAKTHFSELLERAAGGEEITITRHGNPVARLVPIRGGTSPESRRQAIVEMRQLAARTQLAGLSVKELIAEGRR